MAQYPHPFDTEMRYELTEDGNVRVTGRGRSGLFSPEGCHISGELKQADPQLCNWVTNVPDPATQLVSPRMAGRK